LLMTINVVLLCLWLICCELVLLGRLYPSFYIQGEVTRKVTGSVIAWSQSGLYLYLSILHIFYRYNYLRLKKRGMVLWNLLDDAPSRSGPLLGSFESIQGGTSGTHPRQDIMMIVVADA
jgi:hypothetical protein